MNKLGMVLGAAAIATLAGCKDPDYKYDNDPSAQNEVKVVEGEKAAPEVKSAEIKSAEIKPIETAPQPAVQPVVITADVSKPVAESKPAESETTVYVVQSGDSLSKISKRYNVTISSIRRLNPSLKGDAIRIGQKLTLPGKVDVRATAVAASAVAAVPAKKSAAYVGETKTYVVKSGDTLGAIAIANGISVRQLKELNALKKDNIRVGQKLKVPATKVAAKTTKVPAKKAAAPAKKVAEKKAEKPAPAAAPAAPAAAAPEAAAPAAPAVESAPAPAAETPAPAPAAETPAPASAAETPAPAPAEAPAAPAAEAPAAPAAEAAPAATATYVVQEGDDMTGVSIRWGISAAAIRELNNLGENDQLKPGQVIKLPADAQQ